jgi:hypothetical protein
MNTQPPLVRAAIGAFLAALLTSGAAAGQVEDADAPRLRGGAALEGGGVFIPSVLNVGSVGVLGELGIQINRGWAVYAVPSLEAVVGSTSGAASGLGVGAGLVVDYTINNTVSFGAGVDVVAFLTQGGTTCGLGPPVGCAPTPNVSGVFPGGLVRLAYRPLVFGAGTRHRNGLALGLDVRLLNGGLGWTARPADESSSGFGVSPMLWVGYTAF